MIETLTIFDGRIAQAFDYPDNKTDRGDSFRTGPAKIGGQCITVDFEMIGGRVAFASIIDMHTLQRLTPAAWPRRISEAIEAHCRAYAAKHQHLGGAA